MKIPLLTTLAVSMLLLCQTLSQADQVAPSFDEATPGTKLKRFGYVVLASTDHEVPSYMLFFQTDVGWSTISASLPKNMDALKVIGRFAQITATVGRTQATNGSPSRRFVYILQFEPVVRL